MSTITKVICRLKVEGIHRWETCPIEEVSYLRYYHRHIFHIICEKPVTHDDRDVEFIELSHKIKTTLTKEFYSEDHKCMMFGNQSCEMLAKYLLETFDLSKCEVNEDNEGGAVIERES